MHLIYIKHNNKGGLGSFSAFMIFTELQRKNVKSYISDQ